MQRVKKRYILAATLILVVLILKPSLFSRIKLFFFETISFPLKTVNAINRTLTRRSSYAKENSFLKEKSALLALELSRMSSIDRENKRLRRLLSFKDSLSYRALAAQVLGKVPSSWNKAILIDKGSKDGIKKRMAVCTPSGLVGSVFEVGPYTSKVMLITDPNSRVGVLLEETRQAGVLIGDQKGECKIIYLSIDSEIKKGEKVRTSGYGGIFPKDMVVGEVESFGDDSVGFYRYAVIKLSQDLNSLEEVLCIE